MLSAADSQLHREAREVGYLSSSCDGCLGSGRAARNIPSPVRGGFAIDGICRECDGSGRWWFTDGRTLALASLHLTDAELRVLLTTPAPRDGSTRSRSSKEKQEAGFEPSRSAANPRSGRA
jgi:hypothetical protein